MSGYWGKTEGRCDNLGCESSARGLRRMWFEERRTDPDRAETAYAIMLCESCMFSAMADAWAELKDIPKLVMQDGQLLGMVRGRTAAERIPISPEDYHRIGAIAMRKAGKAVSLKTERALRRREKTKVTKDKGRAA